MVYALAPTDPDMPAAIRRIAAQEIAAALAALDDPALPEAERVHTLRKHVKKLRGLIRLVRPRFAGHALENAALREAARGIATLRDTEVMLATLDRLAPRAPAEAAPALARLHATLSDRHAQTRSDGGGATALNAFRAALQAAAARVPDWHLRGEAFNLVEEGLATTWKQAQKAHLAAQRAPTAETMHDWRKRAKDHWYQARILEPLWPEVMAPHIAAADDLGERLGDHHDLALLAAHLETTNLTQAERDLIGRMIRKRQKKLAKKADILATRLFAGSAGALTARWGIWWQVWRDAPPAVQPASAFSISATVSSTP